MKNFGLMNENLNLNKVATKFGYVIHIYSPYLGKIGMIDLHPLQLL